MVAHAKAMLAAQAKPQRENSVGVGRCPLCGEESSLLQSIRDEQGRYWDRACAAKALAVAPARAPGDRLEEGDAP